MTMNVDNQTSQISFQQMPESNFQKIFEVKSRQKSKKRERIQNKMSQDEILPLITSNQDGEDIKNKEKLCISNPKVIHSIRDPRLQRLTQYHLFLDVASNVVRKIQQVQRQYQSSRLFRTYLEVLNGVLRKQVLENETNENEIYPIPQQSPMVYSIIPFQLYQDCAEKASEATWKDLQLGTLFVKDYLVSRFLIKDEDDNQENSQQLQELPQIDHSVLNQHPPNVASQPYFKCVSDLFKKMSGSDKVSWDTLNQGQKNEFTDLLYESFPNKSPYYMRVKFSHLKQCLQRIYKTAHILIEDHETGTADLIAPCPYWFATRNKVESDEKQSYQKGINEIIDQIQKQIFKPCATLLEGWENPWHHQIVNETADNENSLKQESESLVKNTSPKVEVQEVSGWEQQLIKEWGQFIKQLIKSNQKLGDGRKSEQNQLQIRSVVAEISICLNWISSQSKFEIKHPKSSVFDLFQKDYFCQVDETLSSESKQLSKALLLCFILSGNTIDGISISSKILLHQFQDVWGISTFPKQSEYLMSRSFMDWRNRRCHGCLEMIVEARKAVACFNFIRTNQQQMLNNQACNKLYCQRCILKLQIARLQRKVQVSEQVLENSSETSPSKESQLIEKVKISSKLLSKYQRNRLGYLSQKEQTHISTTAEQFSWLRAYQNVLFTCPCCTGECPFEQAENQSDQNQQSKNQNCFSLCTLKAVESQDSMELFNVTNLQNRLILFYVASSRIISCKRDRKILDENMRSSEQYDYLNVVRSDDDLKDLFYMEGQFALAKIVDFQQKNQSFIIQFLKNKTINNKILNSLDQTQIQPSLYQVSLVETEFFFIDSFFNDSKVIERIVTPELKFLNALIKQDNLQDQKDKEWFQKLIEKDQQKLQTILFRQQRIGSRLQSEILNTIEPFIKIIKKIEIQKNQDDLIAINKVPLNINQEYFIIPIRTYIEEFIKTLTEPFRMLDDYEAFLKK